MPGNYGMANQKYPYAFQLFLQGDLSWSADNIRAVLVDTATYTFSAAHRHLADIDAEARVGSLSPYFTNKTTTDGVADADDIEFVSVLGQSVEALVIFQDSGDEDTSVLIAYIDTAIGLPFLPQNQNTTVQWDNGPNRIFVL